MSYYSEASCLIVYGGKGELGSHQSYDDIKILYLYNLTWTTPAISGDQSLKDRFGHCACILDGQMMVFGGLSKGNPVESRADILELSINETPTKINLLINLTGINEVKKQIQKASLEGASTKYQESQKIKEKTKLEQIIKESTSQKEALTQESKVQQG